MSHEHQCPDCHTLWTSTTPDCPLPYVERCIDCAWDVVYREAIGLVPAKGA